MSRGRPPSRDAASGESDASSRGALNPRAWLTHIARAMGLGLQDSSPGARGERAAAVYLKKHGYRILAINVRTRRGELDIVALAPDGRTVVFVEVKTAEASSSSGREADYAPERRVGIKKQRQIAGLAADYLRRKQLTDCPARFDVMGVILAEAPEENEIRHFVAAFNSPW